IQHKGFALVDTFTPCVSFNKTNSRQWYKENTIGLDDAYDPGDRQRAFAKALESDPWPLGIIYQNPKKSTFEENLFLYQEKKTPLIRRALNAQKLADLIASM
ncbi:MAG: 2-oxoacid ferredoxin oxidoreductase, partial [Deltaproteobacteria bacterium]|nr:2-oxoacid ferredoxin oxidoreductase [Deltaproteobacteria bacterium]